MSKILFVMTGVDYWTLADGTKHPTGFWAEEAVAPYEAFTAAGHEIVVATPGGVVPTVDKGSLAPEVNGGQQGADKISAALASITELEHPITLEDVNLGDYAAVFYPGGHGPMEDLAVDETSGKLLINALDSGKPLAIVCHAPAAMLAATQPDDSNAFAGYTVAAFTNAEESQAGLAEKAKWLLQDRLLEAGVNVQEGEPWAPNVVTDRNLITGQNPASSAPLAVEVLEKLA
ncbi:thiamine biosynthesis protein ThiJ [Rhodococcus sp. SC4]|uniref:type 1 glutamine amidotransferase domain-containing protein n=1 Tax=unclassified Rhodococcus (in: high G+C Gram-positive bacteria) TaxID=192944 RepID=UPI00076A24E9|nr:MULTISPECIES: type 1 glutamine amidotransferase domain-containing protein [unclassified Rhodococcus (in: high G+C Gram-positive bacteria)]KXF52670.1 thiamine biosynthesis protein ThiJ [Rhodococcus sp. SC4]KXX62953.1 thiamine biosynthesis protein ThiJ [Rhodococcus sp. LB1]PBC57842.1 type 1 glutamine amidotransferase domain-containing protein [Rhodococcus sp. ACPA1]RZK69825.1 MAG: type 1 glutamine amidotransferase domain-containing protein [Rhodococcus sp. (in: high G+C Gram-positive bacteria)